MKHAEKKISVSRSKKLPWLGFAVKLTGVFLLVLVFFYVAGSFLLDRGFLKRDLQEKFGQVAGATTTALSVRFIGPPNEPVLTATPLCQNYIPYVHLSWTVDDQMDYFDISRDGVPLISGITTNSYDDESVAILTDYVYEVTAFNDFGQATSDLASVTSLNCGTPPIPDPTCEITRFDTINLAGFIGIPSTTNINPIFYGASNIPNAIVEVMVAGGTSIFAITSANANGYWDWSPLSHLNYGEHTIWVTAIDPNDSTRRKTDSLKFKIIKEEEEDGEDEKNKKDEKKRPFAVEVVTPIIPPVPSKPIPVVPEKSSLLSLSVAVKNPDKVGYPGRKLSVETKINIKGDAINQPSVLKYWIVDEKYKEVFQDSDDVFINGDCVIQKELTIPYLLKPGKYKILIDIKYEGMIITAEDNFILKEVPLVRLGGGLTLTIRQIMDNLLWVILWLLVLLLVFLIFLFAEHWISQNAIIQITEGMLNKNGFIIRKK